MTNKEIIEASKIASGIPADTLLLTFNEWKRNGLKLNRQALPELQSAGPNACKS